MEKLSGFFSSDGSKILSKSELKKADAALNKKSSTESAKTDSFTSNDKTVSNALGKVRGNTFEQINQGVSRAQSALDDVKAAKKLVRKEAKVLKNLANAIKDGDSEKAEELKEKFKDLQVEREALADLVQSNSADRGGLARVNIGNKNILTTEVENVKIQRTLGDIDLDDPKSIREARRKLVSEDRAELNQKAQSLKNTLSNLKQVTAQVEVDFKTLVEADETSRSGRNKDLEELASGQAEVLAKDLASRITEAGANSVLAHDINFSIESLLLS
ncbi:MAG: hypothetical protein R3A13_11120 [Bdellovibrionota bacterium]